MLTSRIQPARLFGDAEDIAAPLPCDLVIGTMVVVSWFEVLWAGSPCASKHRVYSLEIVGFEAVRKAVDAQRPYLLCLENVQELAEGAEGETELDVVKEALRAMGYRVWHSAFDAVDDGSRARRKRMYAVGLLGRQNGNKTLGNFLLQFLINCGGSIPSVSLHRLRPNGAICIAAAHRCRPGIDNTTSCEGC